MVISLRRAEGLATWIKERFRRTQRAYPVLSSLAVLFIGWLMGGASPVGSLINWHSINVSGQRVNRTDIQYRRHLIAELERNIRVLQFYISSLRQPWYPDAFMTNTTLKPYVDFRNSQSASLAEVYREDFLGDTLRLYQQFDFATERIRAVNTLGYEASKRDQDIDYFRSLTLQTIRLYEKVAATTGDTTYKSKSYLTDGWELPNVLDANSRQFLEAEDRKVATRSLAILPK